jgi:hypothetical protein
MRTEVHVYPKNGLSRPSSHEIDLLTGPDSPDARTLDLQGNVVENFTQSNSTWTYADGSEIVQAFPGKLYDPR